MGCGASIQAIKAELADKSVPVQSLAWDGCAGLGSLTVTKKGEVTAGDGKVLLSVQGDKLCKHLTLCDPATEGVAFRAIRTQTGNFFTGRPTLRGAARKLHLRGCSVSTVPPRRASREDRDDSSRQE